MPISKIRRVYKETIDKSPLRRLFVDLAVRYCHKDKQDSFSWSSKANRSLYPEAFLFNLAAAQSKKGDGDKNVIQNFMINRAKYYVPTGGQWESNRVAVVEDH